VEEAEEERRRAAERFRKLQVAYETLRDPERRAAYDRGQLLSAGGG
jgi:DnaJ-class molecular chaperone